MNQDFQFKLDNKKSNGPKGWEGMSIISDFTSGKKTLSTSQIEMVADDARAINAWVDSGRMYEGMQLEARLGTDVLKFMLETASDSAEFGADSVKVNIRQEIGLDFLNDMARSFRFEYLYRLGLIKKSMYTPYYYTIGRYPRSIEIMIAALTLYSVIKELISAIKDIVSAIAATVGGLTGVAETILQAIAFVIYIIALFAALIALVKRLIDLIFPFVYIHHAMSMKKQLEIGCAYIGLLFSSTILDNLPGFCVAPPKNTEGKKLGLQLDEPGFWDGTMESLFFLAMDMFSAEVRVIGNTVHLEQWPFFYALSTYTVPPVYTESYKTNASEIKSTFTLAYSYDDTNLYSYDAWKGTSIQVTRELTGVAPKLNQLKGHDDIILGVQLPNVVTKQTSLEKIMGDLWNAITKLTSGVTKALSLFKKGGGGKRDELPKIPKSGSIGAHQQDTHFSSIPMVFIAGVDGKINPNTSSIIGAAKLYGYHKIKSPVGNDILPQGNQWFRYPPLQVPMRVSEFIELTANNYGKFKGYACRFLKLDYNPYTTTAKIDLEINRKFTNKITEKISTDGGKI